MARGRLFRTTAFKLLAAYLLIFTVFAGGLLGYFLWNADRLLGAQVTSAVDKEIYDLSDQYEQGGLVRLIAAIDGRSRRPGSLLYLLTAPADNGIAGNVAELSEGALDRPGWRRLSYKRIDEPTSRARTANARVVAFDGGIRLLVGVDLEERSRVHAIMVNAALSSGLFIIVIGIAGGWFLTRRVLHRLDDINEASRKIMAGDLGRRLAVTGSGDEMDRLATTTNAMLDRIQQLMNGLKEVSDNIAHDLKTPLTRLRNHAEEALRTARTEDEYREALERTIDHSAALIRTFNALLLIGRAEAGQIETTMSDFDAAEVARDVAELYEPLAEDGGLALRVEAPSTRLTLHGNRELIGQALANLVDNAVKYGMPAEDGGEAAITLSVTRAADGIEFTIADHGKGIAENERERVLQRFVRLEQSRSAPGAGLGLSLVAAVIKMHSGAIRLEDNHPGLKVVLSLPAKRPERPLSAIPHRRQIVA